MIAFFKALFKNPLVRHIVAGLLILNYGYIKGVLSETKKDKTQLNETVKEIAIQPKTSVKNIVSDVKVKKGSTLDFTPKTTIENYFDTIDNIDKVEVKELSKKEKRKLRRKQRKLKRLEKRKRRKSK